MPDLTPAELRAMCERYLGSAVAHAAEGCYGMMLRIERVELLARALLARLDAEEAMDKYRIHIVASSASLEGKWFARSWDHEAQGYGETPLAAVLACRDRIKEMESPDAH